MKFLLNNKEAKPRLIRWILSLQEFDIKIKDKRGSENLVADHFYRIRLDDPLLLPIQDSFPDEHIFKLQVKLAPWYVHIVNYLATVKLPNDWDYNESKNFFKTLPNCYWEEPELFYLGVNQVLRRCFLEEERGKIL